MSTLQAAMSDVLYDQGTPITKSSKRHSCVLCQQRKKKCDRTDPCSACSKAGIECIFRAPSSQSRRKKRTTESNLLAQVQRYEKLLKTHGVKTDATDASDAEGAENGQDGNEVESMSEDVAHHNGTKGEEPLSPSIGIGKLFAKQGKSRYLENRLWTSLSEELEDSEKVLRGSSEDESAETTLQTPTDMTCSDGVGLLFGSGAAPKSLFAHHPLPVLISRLWQMFLDNVHPLVHLLHAPSVQKLVLSASQNLRTVPKSLEALMFAIYASAINSLNNAECESTFGGAKTTLLTKYQVATQQALSNATFLKSSDLMNLQAYVLLLLSMRQYSDARSLWILTGVAVRIAQRIGLHRDAASHELRPFEVEMRRRLWWQIVLLDSRQSVLCGSGTSVLAHLWDTKLPLNVNDNELNCDMRELPAPNPGMTEMVFCLVRYEFGQFIWRLSPLGTNPSSDGRWQRLCSTAIPLTEKRKAIDDFESHLEHKFLRYCDPLIPLHFLCTIMVRSAVCQMKLVAHNPRYYSGKGMPIPTNEQEMLFSNSLKMIEYDNLAQSTKSIQRFIWHVNVHFQLDALIYMFGELRLRTTGDLADRAWQQIDEAYDHHPEMITTTKNPLYVAVGNIAIKAWDSREANLKRHYLNSAAAEPPRFISALRSQRSAPPANNSSLVRQGEYTSGQEKFYGLHQSENGGLGDISKDFDPALQSDLLPFDLSPMDWSYWDDLLHGTELQTSDDNGPQFFDQPRDYH